MLNGIAPIILFNIIKIPISSVSGAAKLPLISGTDAQGQAQLLPPIPIYLDEKLTGLAIVSESKNVDIETDTIVLSGADAINNQKPIGSTVTIIMKARRGTIGLALLSGLIDTLFKKVISQEYSITYMHGAIIILGGLLHSFEINENDDSELSEVKLILINPAKQKSTSLIPNPGGAGVQTPTTAVHP